MAENCRGVPSGADGRESCVGRLRELLTYIVLPQVALLLRTNRTDDIWRLSMAERVRAIYQSLVSRENTTKTQTWGFLGDRLKTYIISSVKPREGLSRDSAFSPRVSKYSVLHSSGTRADLTSCVSASLLNRLSAKSSSVKE